MAFLLVLFGLLMLIFLNKISIWRNVGLSVAFTDHRTGVTPTSMTAIMLATGANWAFYDAFK